MFEILEHTADIGFRAHGATRAEMFEEAALALVSVATDPASASPRQLYRLAASGEDLESLLVNWLSEVLFHLDGRQVVPCRFQVDSVSETHVTGRAWGEPRDPARHPHKLTVKGVTYHQLQIDENSVRGHSARVFLDI